MGIFSDQKYDINFKNRHFDSKNGYEKIGFNKYLGEKCLDFGWKNADSGHELPDLGQKWPNFGQKCSDIKIG